MCGLVGGIRSQETGVSSQEKRHCLIGICGITVKGGQMAVERIITADGDEVILRWLPTIGRWSARILGADSSLRIGHGVSRFEAAWRAWFARPAR